MSVNNDTLHSNPAIQKDLEAAHPTGQAATENTRLLGSQAIAVPAGAANSSLFGRFVNGISNLSTKKKICLAAAVVLGVGGIATAIALWPTNTQQPPSPAPCWRTPHNATEICNAISTIGSQYLQWLSQAPGITSLQSVQNGIRELFCSGAKVVDPATIAWAQNILPQLNNAIANQTAIALTGAPYDPMNPGAHQSNPTRLYNLIYHANADFKETDNWFGMEDFWAPGWIQWAPEHIPLSLMRQGATMALKEFCDRMQFSDILFGNETYTCVTKQFANYIPQYAGWCFWPK